MSEADGITIPVVIEALKWRGGDVRTDPGRTVMHLTGETLDHLVAALRRREIIHSGEEEPSALILTSDEWQVLANICLNFRESIGPLRRNTLPSHMALVNRIIEAARQ